MEVFIQAKLDGCSACLTYKDGTLVSLATRGDGEVGDDITVHAKHIPGIPQKLDATGTIYVRGEIVLPLANFKSYWTAKGAKNPRNTVSGLIKGRSSAEDLGTLMFVAYDLYSPARGTHLNTESDILSALQVAGFHIPALAVLVNTADEAAAVYTRYDKEVRDTLPYLTDGLVFKLNRLEEQDQFQTTNGRPGWATAVKPSPKAVVTKVNAVVWTMGLSGRFCPVAQVEPCDLDGTTLRNVNLFNLDNIRALAKKGFGVGCEILVIRTGDVLPHLKEVVAPKK